MSKEEFKQIFFELLTEDDEFQKKLTEFIFNAVAKKFAERVAQDKESVIEQGSYSKEFVEKAIEQTELDKLSAEKISVENQRDALKKQLAERFADGWEVYQKFLSLDASARKSSGLFVENFMAFICRGAQMKRLDDIWEFALECKRAGKIDSAEILWNVFSYCVRLVNAAQGNRRPRFFIDGKEVIASCLYTQLSWATKTFNSSAARSVFAVAARKNYFCLESTGQLVENIGAAVRVCGSNPMKSAVLIPVCNLPLENKFGDKKIAAACAILEAGLVPINSELGDVEQLCKRYLQMKNYLTFDGDFRLDVAAWQAVAEHDEHLPIPINEDWYEKNPKLDVKTSGICAIDFGTKNTVAVCLDDGKRLLRIGRGNFLCPNLF